MKIVIGPHSGGFVPVRAVLDRLFEESPESFDAILFQDIYVPLDDDATLSIEAIREKQALWHETAISRGDYLHFLKNFDNQVRTLPWLVDLAERDGAAVSKYPVKVIDVPDDVKWYIRREDDNSESIHEEHRIWR